MNIKIKAMLLVPVGFAVVAIIIAIIWYAGNHPKICWPIGIILLAVCFYNAFREMLIQREERKNNAAG